MCEGLWGKDQYAFGWGNQVWGAPGEEERVTDYDAAKRTMQRMPLLLHPSPSTQLNTFSRIQQFLQMATPYVAIAARGGYP